MKSITESINEACIQHGEMSISRGRRHGWMTYDENSGTVIAFSADRESDLALEYSTEEDYWDEIWLLKPGETFVDPQTKAITTKLW